MFKKLLKRTPLYQPLRRLRRRLSGVPRHPLQDVPPHKGLPVSYLGTEYGGWAYVDDGSLQGCTILSAGLGEDASFDVEFAKKHAAKVIIIDPTPRAVAHFNAVVSRLGSERRQAYVNAGSQPVEAYDLTGIPPGNLVLIEKALWNTPTRLKFYSGANPSHVSHSIVNYQNDYQDAGSHIEVEATTVPMLLSELQLAAEQVPLLKMDIEGAEIEVLMHCMESGIFPRQILVEFDELNMPSEKGFERVTRAHRLLVENGYTLVHTDGQADFLYLRNQA